MVNFKVTRKEQQDIIVNLKILSSLTDSLKHNNKLNKSNNNYYNNKINKIIINKINKFNFKLSNLRINFKIFLAIITNKFFLITINRCINFKSKFN